jgi:hypothetical protein
VNHEVVAPTFAIDDSTRCCSCLCNAE